MGDVFSLLLGKVILYMGHKLVSILHLVEAVMYWNQIIPAQESQMFAYLNAAFIHIIMVTWNPT